jgi:Fur family ferric uptake transcriptional regulator
MVVNIDFDTYGRSVGRHPAAASRPSGGANGDEIGDEIAALLRAAGLSPTPRRRQVLEALGRRQRPVSAHELYVEMVGAGRRIGMSTVYRTLSALAEGGLLHVFESDGETRYRCCTLGRHYHLVCRRCGTVQDHPVADEDRWLARLCSEADFAPDLRHADVPGVCGNCLRSGRDNTGRVD